MGHGRRRQAGQGGGVGGGGVGVELRGLGRGCIVLDDADQRTAHRC